MPLWRHAFGRHLIVAGPERPVELDKLALGVVFAHCDLRLAFFGAATAIVLWLLPRFAPWFFAKVGHREGMPLLLQPVPAAH